MARRRGHYLAESLSALADIFTAGVKCLFLSPPATPKVVAGLPTAACGSAIGARNPVSTAFNSCPSLESSPSSQIITPPMRCWKAYAPLKRADTASSYVQKVLPSNNHGAWAVGSRYTVDEAISV